MRWEYLLGLLRFQVTLNSERISWGLKKAYLFSCLFWFVCFLMCWLIKQVIRLSCFLTVLFAYFWGDFLYDSTTEPHSAATRQTARDWNKQTAALFPHSLHPPRGPVQGPPEQEEGLVVRALRWALDRSADGAAPWQGTHSACSRLVWKAGLQLGKCSELMMNFRKRLRLQVSQVVPSSFFFFFFISSSYLGRIWGFGTAVNGGQMFQNIIWRCNWSHVLLAHILQFGKP